MKTVLINQARMGSTRLPGKILKKVNGRPFLSYQIQRLRACKEIDEIVIATTESQKDDELVEFCKNEGMAHFRGSEEDVVSRYYLAAKKHNADAIVRVTSDCPLIDPNVIDKVVRIFKEARNEFDYVSNTLIRTFPRGMDTEVFKFSALKEAYEKSKGSEREHVTPYIYNHPKKFKLKNISNTLDQSEYRWTLDTPEDLELLNLIMDKATRISMDFTLNDLIEIISENPKWTDINSYIEQKKT